MQGSEAAVLVPQALTWRKLMTPSAAVSALVGRA